MPRFNQDRRGQGVCGADVWGKLRPMTDWEKLTADLIDALERSRVRELAQVLANTRRLLWNSFISGIFRGLGTALGFSVLGALALLLLGKIFGVQFS